MSNANVGHAITVSRQFARLPERTLAHHARYDASAVRDPRQVAVVVLCR